MLIRLATVDDIKVLQILSNEVVVDNSKYDPDVRIDWSYSEDAKKYFLNIARDSKSICLIAEENKEAIGYLAAGPKERGYCLSKYLEIDNMGTLPQYRSKGVGSKLMAECLKIAKEKGYQKVYVNVYYKNERAVKFYENNSFLRIDVDLEKDI